MSPPSSAFNSNIYPVTITGSGFRKGVLISLTNGTTTIPGNVTNQTQTQILCTLPLSDVKAGLYTLTILILTAHQLPKVNAFTIKDAETNPTITEITPSSGTNKAPLAVIINGTYFQVGATVSITNGLTTKTVTPTSVTPM